MHCADRAAQAAGGLAAALAEHVEADATEVCRRRQEERAGDPQQLTHSRTGDLREPRDSIRQGVVGTVPAEPKPKPRGRTQAGRPRWRTLVRYSPSWMVTMTDVAHEIQARGGSGGQETGAVSRSVQSAVSSSAARQSAEVVTELSGSDPQTVAILRAAERSRDEGRDPTVDAIEVGYRLLDVVPHQPEVAGVRFIEDLSGVQIRPLPGTDWVVLAVGRAFVQELNARTLPHHRAQLARAFSQRATADRIAAILDATIVTDGDVEHILRILAPLSGPSIGQMVRAMPEPAQATLVDELNAPHATRRRVVLEVLYAAPSLAVGSMDLDVLRAMRFGGSSERERRLLLDVFEALDSDDRNTILADPHVGTAVRLWSSLGRAERELGRAERELARANRTIHRAERPRQEKTPGRQTLAEIAAEKSVVFGRATAAFQLQEGVALDTEAASIEIPPGGSLLRVEVTPEGLNLTIAQPALARTKGFLGLPANALIHGVTYAWGGRNVTVEATPTFGLAGGTVIKRLTGKIRDFFRTLVADTEFARPGFDPLNDPNVLGEIDKVRDNLARRLPAATDRDTGYGGENVSLRRLRLELTGAEAGELFDETGLRIRTGAKLEVSLLAPGAAKTREHMDRELHYGEKDPEPWMSLGRMPPGIPLTSLAHVLDHKAVLVAKTEVVCDPGFREMADGIGIRIPEGASAKLDLKLLASLRDISEGRKENIRLLAVRASSPTSIQIARGEKPGAQVFGLQLDAQPLAWTETPGAPLAKGIEQEMAVRARAHIRYEGGTEAEAGDSFRLPEGVVFDIDLRAVGSVASWLKAEAKGTRLVSLDVGLSPGLVLILQDKDIAEVRGVTVGPDGEVRATRVNLLVAEGTIVELKVPALAGWGGLVAPVAGVPGEVASTFNAEASDALLKALFDHGEALEQAGIGRTIIEGFFPESRRIPEAYAGAEEAKKRKRVALAEASRKWREHIIDAANGKRPSLLNLPRESPLDLSDLGQVIEEVPFGLYPLEGASLTDNSFVRCNFYMTRLRGAELRDCTFQHCSFVDTELDPADLRGSEFEDCTFDHARLEGAQLDGAVFRRCSFHHASTKGHTALGTTFEHCSGMEAMHVDPPPP